LLADATDDILLLEELSVAAQPLWGHRLAIGQSRLCVWRLDGLVGKSSFASVAPGLDESLLTLLARCGEPRRFCPSCLPSSTAQTFMRLALVRHACRFVERRERQIPTSSLSCPVIPHLISHLIIGLSMHTLPAFSLRAHQGLLF
jgi:hypothetical protein